MLHGYGCCYAAKLISLFIYNIVNLGQNVKFEYVTLRGSITHLLFFLQKINAKKCNEIHVELNAKKRTLKAQNTLFDEEAQQDF